MKAVFFLIIALTAIFAGCRDDTVAPIAYKRAQKSYDLAVEGSLNTTNTLQFIKLTKPAILPDGQVTPISGATVSISDGNNEVFLSETNTRGVYSGNIFDNKNYGKSYSLKVHYNAKDYLATDTLVALQPDDLPFTATQLSNGQIELNIPAHIFGASRPVRWLIAYKGIQNWAPAVFNVQYPYTYSSQLGAPNAVYPLEQDGRIADLSPTDTVTVYKFSQSQSYAAFLYNLFQETDFKSIFSSEPGNVYGNVSGSAEGYFHCTDVSVTKYLAKNLVK